MIAYILKSIACLALMLFFYHLVLEKEKMHNFNRFYLLIGVIASFLIPLTTITTYVEPIFEPNTSEVTQTFITQIFDNNSAISIQEQTIDYSQIALYFYTIISFMLLIRFGINLFKIIRKTKLNKTIIHQKAKLVLVEDSILPHTFWNYIFINKKDYENKKIEQELFTHELTHVNQKHTLDVLLIEFLQAIFWINPLFIFIKKAIQLNHEFLADQTVINTYKNTFQYQHLLLNKAAWNNEYYLASNLNYSLTKKRLKMMTTQSSPTKILFKKLAVIPLLTGFIFLFAERVEAQTIIEENEQPIETIIEDVSNNVLDYSKNKLYKEYVYSKGRFNFKAKNGKKTLKKYADLSNEEKNQLVPPPPLKLKRNAPAKQQFEDLKNTKKYAVWIDGKVANNIILEKYSYKDFARYANSFVHKNARSKKFPQEYQARLETEKYFKYQNEKRVNQFLNYLKEKHNIEEIEEEVKPKVIEIKEQKKKYNSPSSNGSKQVYLEKPVLNSSLKTGFKNIDGTIFYFVSTKEITKYFNKKGFLANEEGKEITSKKAKASEIIPGNYVKKTFYKGAVFCEFEDDKPSNQQDKTSSFKRVKELFNNLKEIDKPLFKYNKTNKFYEAIRNKKPHYIKSSNKRKETLDKVFSELGSLYFKLSKEDKRKTERPIHPFKPYVQLKKNGKVFYKLKEELTEEDKMFLPPPPLRPNTSKKEKISHLKELRKWESKTQNNSHNNNNPTIKLIESLAKKDAKFYFENKLITSAKALQLVRQNPKMRIESKSTNDENYIARLYKNNSKKNSKIDLEKIKQIKSPKAEKTKSNKKNQLDESD
jgi:bla regulator protein blaR1